MEEYDAILRLVDTGGSIALLLLVVFLGYTGRVVPSALLETIIRRVVEDVLDELDRRGKL